MSFPVNVIDIPYTEIFNNTAERRSGMLLGQIGVTPDGRIFRYGLVGGVDIAAARLTQTEAPAGTSDELAIPTARAIGDRTVTVTVNLVDGDLAMGYLNVEDDTGEGHLYSIRNNTDDGTTTTVELEQGLVVAWDTNTTVGLWQNPFKDIIIHPSPPVAMLTGVTPRAQGTGRYGWFQTLGLASVLIEGTVVIGRQVMPSSSADGAVTPRNFTLTEATPNTLDGTQNLPTVGITHEVAATTEEGTIWLTGLGI